MTCGLLMEFFSVIGFVASLGLLMALISYGINEDE